MSFRDGSQPRCHTTATLPQPPRPTHLALGSLPQAALCLGTRPCMHARAQGWLTSGASVTHRYSQNPLGPAQLTAPRVSPGAPASRPLLAADRDPAWASVGPRPRISPQLHCSLPSVGGRRGVETFASSVWWPPTSLRVPRTLTRPRAPSPRGGRPGLRRPVSQSPWRVRCRLQPLTRPSLSKPGGTSSPGRVQDPDRLGARASPPRVPLGCTFIQVSCA